MHKKLLNFNQQYQRQSQWCWAAVACSISKYYFRRSRWTQCHIVCNELSDTRCCDKTLVPSCNRPWSLRLALERTGNYFNQIYSPISFSAVKRQIDLNNVIGVRIAWTNGTGHFVTLSGYWELLGVNYYYIEDPRKGSPRNRLISEDALRRNYLTNGVWTDTYLTKFGGNTMIKETFIDRKLRERANKIAEVMFPKKRYRLLKALKTGLEEFSHPMYNITFESIRSKQLKLKEAGFRYFNLEQMVLFNLGGAGEQAEITEIIFDENYLYDYVRFYFTAFEKGMMEDRTYDLGFVIQSELNRSAFCLIDKNQIHTENLYLEFIPSIAGKNVFYNEDEYLRILSELSENSRPYDDQLGG